MKFGVVQEPSPITPDVAETADALGYTSFWLYDTPLAQADPYVYMGLCANRTKTIRLGVGVTSPRLRSAAVTAAALSSVDELAPGRVALGIGTGNTGRRTFGMPPARLAEVEKFVSDFRALRAREQVEYVEDGRRSTIKFLHSRPSFGQEPIEVIMAAAGPKAAATARRIADGVVTYGGVNPLAVAPLVASYMGEKPASAESGSFSTMTAVHVVRAGQDKYGPESRKAVGHVVLSLLAFVLQNPGAESILSPDGKKAAEEYAASLGWPGDPATGHQRLYDNYLGRIRDDLVELVIPELIDSFTIVGDPEECRRRVSDLEQAGVTDLVIQPVVNPIEELKVFQSEVVERL